MLTLPDDPLSLEELQLAARNRGMPLEALRYDVTPTGLHYLLVHFDIPYVDARTWRLEIGGAVERPLKLSLDEIKALPQRTVRVTMECAGNGRARFRPRPLSQPWLYEAIGTAEWTGTPVWSLLERAGLASDAVEVVFIGADHGTQDDIEHDYARSLSIAELRDLDVMLAYAMNGAPLEPQHGFPLRLLVPGWYGMTSVKWLTTMEAVRRAFDGYQQQTAYWFHADDGDPGTPSGPDPCPRPDGAARNAGLLHPPPNRGLRVGGGCRPRVVGRCPSNEGRIRCRRRLVGRPARRDER